MWSEIHIGEQVFFFFPYDILNSLDTIWKQVSFNSVSLFPHFSSSCFPSSCLPIFLGCGCRDFFFFFHCTPLFGELFLRFLRWGLRRGWVSPPQQSPYSAMTPSSSHLLPPTFLSFLIASSQVPLQYVLALYQLSPW